MLSIFILTNVLVSCGSIHNSSDKQSNRKIDFHATVHKPYCGGTLPNLDVANGYYEPMKYQKFYVFEGKTLQSDIKPFKTIALDHQGNIELKLPEGEYFLLRDDKLLGLDEFIKKNGPFETENYQLKDKSCFTNWKNSPDFLFVVSQDTTIDYVQKAKCWVGTNPCIEYTGPPAP